MQITQNTVWSSKVVLSEDVQVGPGVQLTIAPGTIVEGNNFKLQVYGTLSSQGELGSEILLRNIKYEIISQNNQFGSIIIDRAQLIGGDLGYYVGSLSITNSIVFQKHNPTTLFMGSLVADKIFSLRAQVLWLLRLLERYSASKIMYSTNMTLLASTEH